jgi:hypothetical protein
MMVFIAVSIWFTLDRFFIVQRHLFYFDCSAYTTPSWTLISRLIRLTLPDFAH